MLLMRLILVSRTLGQLVKRPVPEHTVSRYRQYWQFV